MACSPGNFKTGVNASLLKVVDQKKNQKALKAARNMREYDTTLGTGSFL